MLYLRKVLLSDKENIMYLYARSTELHEPWTYPPKDYNSYVNDKGRYLLCLQSNDEIVGSFQISGIVKANFYSCYLGYEVFHPYENKGYMSFGTRLIIQEIFEVLKLHRVEANIQPENKYSIKLIRNMGFIKEGYSKSYLNVGDRGWKDHERWALINEHWNGLD